MLTSGEIVKGMYVTVLSRKPIIKQEVVEEFGTRTIVERQITDNSEIGKVLKVMSVQLPFIAVCDATSSYPINYIMDTRGVTLMELNEEMVSVLVEKK